MIFNTYDVIVVGAGHAGCEAAHAAATMGCKVLLITMNMETIAKMSCNPAMGGVAKGQIIREIDALGGMSGIITDKTMIQFRMLNKSKGPAMWSPRAQSDRWRFSEEWRLCLEKNNNIDFFQDTVKEVIIQNHTAQGVITQMGIKILGKAVVLTNGTFLNGKIHVGLQQFSGGRMGEAKATGITAQLQSVGFSSGRMKTGTPPRIDGRSLDYSQMTEQEGDTAPQKFSYSKETTPLPRQRSCYITYTNEQTHEILRKGFEHSPMFSGEIEGLGPRYCPSIEDKINRFAERNRHQIFVEPEGWNTIEVYVNGFSTSLPEDIQHKAIQTIPGFASAKMFRPGYAIEYDFFQPTQLLPTLETHYIQQLYFAGQINGTTGYEEAACQGLMAGINAALKVQEKNPLILHRNQAYIGVLIDDLINKGTEEPYRMFTSRAEFRILLRQDNADQRLTQIGYEIGLASLQRWEQTQTKYQHVQEIMSFLHKNSVNASEANPLLQQLQSPALPHNIKADKLLLRPEWNMSHLLQLKDYQTLNGYEWDEIEQAEIQIKYQSYLEKETEQAEKINRLENLKIHPDFDYHKLKALSNEAKEKLTQIKPITLGQAGRISGVSPADLSILLVYFGR
jgi:tRNA uridine 5-carboxymethylaminomethyl modification enzyme